MKDADALTIDRYWDAGDAGCGHFIVGLRGQLGQMKAGEFLQVTAFNAGAPADLPAWCRMTGHRLISARHPVYVVRKKGNSIQQHSNSTRGETNV